MKRRMILAAAVILLAGWSDDDAVMDADPRRQGESWDDAYRRMDHEVRAEFDGADDDVASPGGAPRRGVGGRRDGGRRQHGAGG